MTYTGGGRSMVQKKGLSLIQKEVLSMVQLSDFQQFFSGEVRYKGKNGLYLRTTSPCIKKATLNMVHIIQILIVIERCENYTVNGFSALVSQVLYMKIKSFESNFSHFSAVKK